MLEKIKVVLAKIKRFIVLSFLWALFLFTALMLIIFFTPVSNYMAAPLVVEAELKDVDVIGVLGGGAYENNILSPLSNERLIHGLRLYKAGLSGRITFLGGSITNVALKLTTSVTKSDGQENIDVIEAAIMRDIALEFGLSPAAVFMDTESTNTYGNIKALERLIREEGLKSCLVVTGPLHSYRTMRVVNKLSLGCAAAPSGDYTPYVKSGSGRLALMRRVIWEYAALALYKAYGYI